ncbi:MAG: O-methyltransferase [Aestuariivirgaceae bacterium]
MTDELLEYVHANAVRGRPDTVIDAIDGFSKRRGGMIHLGHEKGRILDRIVTQSGAGNVLELGTNFGYSALRIVGKLDAAAKITTVEIDPDLASTAEAIIAFAGARDRVDVICGDASEVIGRLDRPFDVIFIDHLPENYLPALNMLEQSGLLRQGSTIVTDNVVMFENRLQPYLTHLRHSGRYESTLHQPAPWSDGIEVSTCIAGPSDRPKTHRHRCKGSNLMEFKGLQQKGSVMNKFIHAAILAMPVIAIPLTTLDPVLAGGTKAQWESKMKSINKVTGRVFEYTIGDFHLRVRFQAENQLKWEYLSAPDGLTGKTRIENIDRRDIHPNIILMAWTEADGSQVIDVLDLGQMVMHANFVTPDGKKRFFTKAEVTEIK